MARHRTVTGDNVHGPFRKVFADESARTGDVGPYLATESVQGGSLNPVVSVQTDTDELYYLDDHDPISWVLIAGGSATLYYESFVQEMHKVTAGEVSSGYFTLAQNPKAATSVVVTIVSGLEQVNKQCVGSTGATPDFDVLSTNRVHINNNGGASGLSGDIEADDILVITYTVETAA